MFISQRRWIVVSNPSLSALISKWLGTEAWIRDVDLLAGLQEQAANADLHEEWRMVTLCMQLLWNNLLHMDLFVIFLFL